MKKSIIFLCLIAGFILTRFVLISTNGYAAETKLDLSIYGK